MHVRNGWNALAIVAMVSVAGCLGGAGTKKDRQDPSVEIPDEYGSLAGTVVDDELAAVPQVRIEVKENQLWTISDVNGRFRFDFLPPGTYNLEAKLREFEPVREKVEVHVGVETPVTIHVTFPPVTRPYKSTQILQGYFPCHVQGLACPGYDQTNKKNVFPVQYAPNLTAVLAETVWTTSVGHPLINKFRVYAFWKTEGIPRDHQDGQGYIRLELNKADLNKVDGEGFRIEVRSEFSDGANHPVPGAAVEQPFTLYLTTFFITDDMKGYTAVPE